MDNKEVTVIGDLSKYKSSRGFLVFFTLALVFAFLYFLPEIDKYLNPKEETNIKEGYTPINEHLFQMDIHIQNINFEKNNYLIFSEKDINLDENNINLTFYDKNYKELFSEKLSGKVSNNIKTYKFTEKINKDAKYYNLVRKPYIKTTTTAPKIKIDTLNCKNEKLEITYTFENDKLQMYQENNKIVKTDVNKITEYEASIEVFKDKYIKEDASEFFNYKIVHNYKDEVEYINLYNDLDFKQIKENMTEKGFICE